ncbi:phytase [Alteromonas sp. A081]|uniref:phytase n=1 Tax=Alteromonas sp. A081 TaxID=3410269 RepID=UPI003B982D87
MLLRLFSYGVATACLSLSSFATNANLQPVSALFSDDVETYASHAIDEYHQLVAHIDPLTQALIVSSMSNSMSSSTSINSASISQSMTEQYRTGLPQADVETLCLFEDKHGIGVFMFDARGMAQQHYLYQKATKTWQHTALREFAMGGEPEYCTVDNASGQIFIAEEGIGVWQMSVAPESELSRYLAPLPLDEDTVSISLISAEKAALTDEIGMVFPFDVQPVENERDDLPMLVVDGQTDPVQRFGDAADDPAIWVDSKSPAKSLIIGTDKKAGLDVFDLNGQRLQHLPIGKVNNVDVRQSVRFGQQTMDLAVASNRTGNTLSVFNIDVMTRQVSHVADLPTPLTDAYGLCLYQPEQGLEVFINDTDGRYLRYKLNVNKGEFSASLMEQFEVPSQPEGCVADDTHQQLIYGEEAAGIWLRNIAEVGSASIKVANLSEKVHADIEGMDMYHIDDLRYLVASSQGNDSYAVYAIDDDFRWLGSFRIAPNFNKGIDGASETDGLAISSVNLGKAFPYGLLVVQDGRNVMPSNKQNFKLVSGAKVREFILNHR